MSSNYVILRQLMFVSCILEVLNLVNAAKFRDLSIFERVTEQWLSTRSSYCVLCLDTMKIRSGEAQCILRCDYESNAPKNHHAPLSVIL